MGHTMRHRLRRYAISTVIAVAPIAVLCAYVSNLLVPTEPLPKPVYYNVVPTASIDQSNETIGIADSDMYDPALTEADIIKRFDEMQALGVDTIRVLVPWGAIELVPPGTPPPFNVPPDWSRIDFIVDQAMSRDMGVLGILNGTPWWAGGVISPGVAPPVDQFAAFARLAAERFAGRISAYEVWNEPNLLHAWLPAPDPAAYTEMLKAVWNAIKGPNGADPTATVVAGVLIAAIDSPWTIDARTFVEEMYANGAKGFFDALSFHPYQYTTKFSEGAYDPAVNPHEPWKADSPLEMLLAIRQTMIDNGDSALRIWATEYGLPTAGPNAVTPEQQAEFIEDFLDAWDDLRDANGDEFTGPSFIYTLIDRMDGTEDGSFGLFYKDANGNWVRKPAADVVEDAINNPPPGPGPGPGPDPGQAIAQALAALYQQMFQALADAFANAIAQALACLFSGINPPAAPATALSLPVEESGVAPLSMSELTTGIDVPDVAGLRAAEVPGDEVVAEAEVVDVEAAAADPTVVEVTETETPAEPTAEVVETEEPTTVTEEPTALTEEPTTSTEETTSTEDATTDEPKANDEEPPNRKESEDEAQGESKKDSDKPSDDGNRADGATSGGKHETGNVKNGTSVNENKDRLAKESAGADASSSTGSEAAA